MRGVFAGSINEHEFKKDAVAATRPVQGNRNPAQMAAWLYPVNETEVLTAALIYVALDIQTVHIVATSAGVGTAIAWLAATDPEVWPFKHRKPPVPVRCDIMAGALAPTDFDFIETMDRVIEPYLWLVAGDMDMPMDNPHRLLRGSKHKWQVIRFDEDDKALMEIFGWSEHRVERTFNVFSECGRFPLARGVLEAVADREVADGDINKAALTAQIPLAQ